jgi:hypothetical protein
MVDSGHRLGYGELGQHGHPDAGRHERQRRVVVLGPSDEARGEAGGPAGLGQDPATGVVMEVVVDHREPVEGRHRDPLGVLGQQLVPTRCHHAIALLDQDVPAVARALGSGTVGRLGGDVDVVAVGGHRAGPELGEAHLHDELGELPAQSLRHPRQPELGRRRERADGQASGASLAQMLHHTPEARQAPHHLLALGGQHPCRRRGCDTAAGLLEEDQAGLALESGQALADSGRCVAEVVGRRLHRTTGHDGAEDAEALDVEHATTVQHHYMFGK